ERRLLGEYVFFQAALQVGHLVAADAGADDRNVQILVLLVQSVLDKGDVTLLADAALGDGVAEEDDLLALLQGGFGGGSAHGNGGTGENGKSKSAHDEDPWCGCRRWRRRFACKDHDKPRSRGGVAFSRRRQGQFPASGRGGRGAASCG